jgi:hypothetical protein
MNACSIVSVHYFLVAFLILQTTNCIANKWCFVNLKLKETCCISRFNFLYTRQINKGQGQHLDLENIQSIKEDEKKHTYGNISGNNFIA